MCCTCICRRRCRRARSASRIPRSSHSRRCASQGAPRDPPRSAWWLGCSCSRRGSGRCCPCSLRRERSSESVLRLRVDSVDSCRNTRRRQDQQPYSHQRPCTARGETRRRRWAAVVLCLPPPVPAAAAWAAAAAAASAAATPAAEARRPAEWNGVSQQQLHKTAGKSIRIGLTFQQ